MKKYIFTLTIALFLGHSINAQTTEWDDYFMPGVGYKVYMPKNQDTLGIYQGAMVEFIVRARAKGTDSYSSGPARIKSYGNLSIMNSDHATAKDIFLANVGIQLSFEGSTDRKFFLPVFGLEVGGLFQRDFSTFELTPVAGIQLISTETMIWNIQGGYQYTTKRFDDYSGFTFGSTFNILLWNRPDKEKN